MNDAVDRELLQATPYGLYCAAGDFYVDPSRPVKRAVVSHAHSDHATWGCDYYLAAAGSERLMRMRLDPTAEFQFLAYGESISIQGVTLSLHPAGHMLGSAQIRLERRGRVAVVTGDYKLEDDPTSPSWVPIDCHLLVTESTFGLPIYRWGPPQDTADEINRWWRRCRDQETCCLLYGYAVGKAQRLLAGLDDSIGPIYTHGAVEKGTQAYRESGVRLPQTQYVGHLERRHDFRGSLVLAVPSAHGTSWVRRFGRTSTAMASGWMAVRGARRRRAVDRGFVISDHVDWPSLLTAIESCDPETVWVTHGYTAAVARHLKESGRHAVAIASRGRGERDEDAALAQKTPEVAE